MSDVKLTVQEKAIYDYILTKTNGTLYWEELVQFSKDPQGVKRKTIQKTISEIRRKYKAAGESDPIQNVVFKTMTEALLPPMPLQVATTQALVHVKTTPDGNMMRVNSAVPSHPAQVDFVLDKFTRRVRTRFGQHQLNESEWELFKYVHANVGRLITISELRDKVVYPQYGSKLPARWFDSIMRIVNNLRRQVVGLDKRLLTVKGIETTYLFQ